MSLPELDLDYKKFLDKSTVLYGESKTGKSFVTIDLLHLLNTYIEQICVIAPTDRQNHTYDRGVVPKVCIHYCITAKLLEDIWERQNALVAVYTRAQRMDILKQLFNRLQVSSAMAMIHDIERKLAKYEEELQDSSLDENDIHAKIQEMYDECQRLIAIVFKHYINENRERLAAMNLSVDEQFSLKYLNLNPRLVIVFDDCTDLLKKFRAHPVMQKLFYQGRWAYITIIIACHTDKALDPELKKNVFVSIFTGERSARSYFERKSNDLDRNERAEATAACKATFTPLARYQKLVWVRDENRFYRFTASAHIDFKFGSPAFREYCRRIEAEDGVVAPGNKFIHEFM